MRKLSIIVIAVAITAIFLGAFLVNAAPPQGTYTFKYTTGPIRAPQGTGALDWALLNNAATTQAFRVTIYTLPILDTKTVWLGLVIEDTLDPGETTHNANNAFSGTMFEIVVETNSKQMYPSASFWTSIASGSQTIPGSEVVSAEFIRVMP